MEAQRQSHSQPRQLVKTDPFYYYLSHCNVDVTCLRTLPALKLPSLDPGLVLVFLLQLTRLVVGAEDVLPTNTLAGIEQLVGAAVTVGLLDGQSLVGDAAVLLKMGGPV